MKLTLSKELKQSLGSCSSITVNLGSFIWPPFGSFRIPLGFYFCVPETMMALKWIEKYRRKEIMQQILVFCTISSTISGAASVRRGKQFSNSIILGYSPRKRRRVRSRQTRIKVSCFELYFVETGKLNLFSSFFLFQGNHHVWKSSLSGSLLGPSETVDLVSVNKQRWTRLFLGSVLFSLKQLESASSSCKLELFSLL